MPRLGSFFLSCHGALGVPALLTFAACGASSSGSRRDRDAATEIPEPDLAEPARQGGDAGVRGDDGSIDPGGGGPDTCHEEKFAPKSVADPDILLIQDLSGSMADGNPSKYSLTSKAVSSVITQLEAAKAPIQWGLLFFPSDGDCGVKMVPEVPVAAGNAKPIATKLGASKPQGNTPLATGVTNAVKYYDTLKDNRGHVLLVATDGEPNCDAGGGLPKQCKVDKDCDPGQTCMVIPLLGGLCTGGGGGEAVKAVAAARVKGLKTYVVGIDLGGSSATLNQLAVEGGTARMGQTKYYPVADQASLEMALKNITSQIISCSFALTTLPQANQMVIVQVGGGMVPRDKNHGDGWDIDDMTKTLTLYGKFCAQLQQQPGQVSVGYTCPPPG